MTLETHFSTYRVFCSACARACARNKWMLEKTSTPAYIGNKAATHGITKTEIRCWYCSHIIPALEPCFVVKFLSKHYTPTTELKFEIEKKVLFKEK